MSNRQKNPKPEEDGRTRSVHKEVVFTEPERQGQTSAETSPRVSPPENEDERFFFELCPELRKSWKSLMERRSSSSPRRSSSPRVSRPIMGEEIYLQREMGLYGAINFLIIGAIGTEIYLTPAEILDRASSTAEALLVWVISGFFSLLVAVTYGELVFLVSQSGETFSYLLAAFSPINKFFGPIPAFLNIWIDGLFLGPAQVSLLVMTLAEHAYLPIASSLKLYANVMVTEPITVKQVIAITALGVITCINFRSIKTCIRIQIFLGIFIITICLLVIGGGVYSLNKGNVDNFNSMFKDVKGNPTGFIKAIHKGMWAYEGWNQVITVSEEIKNPLRTIPRAVIIGLPIVIILYLAVNVALLTVLKASEIKGAPFKYIYDYEEKLLGSKYMIVPICVAISAVSSAMCIQLGTSRTCFAAGREGHMLEIVTYLNVRRFVPTPAIIMQALLSCIYIIYIPLLDLIEYSKFLIWTFYGFSFVALIILRVKMADTRRLYKTPLSIPIFLTTMCVLVSIDPMFKLGGKAFFIAVAVYCLGILVYHQLVYKQKRLFGMDHLNKFTRYVLNVAPPTALPEGYTHPTIRPHYSASMTVALNLKQRDKYYSQ